MGVEKLILNGPVLKVESVELQPGDPGYHDPDCPGFRWVKKPNSDGFMEVPSPCGDNHDVLAVYGYRFITENPTFGEQSTVVAFRNNSNGFYGGWMQKARTPGNIDELRMVTSDWQADDRL